MSDAITPNPYAAPVSDLQPTSNNQVPSIEEALARGYDFSIGDLLSESWSKVKGTKGIIIGGFLVFYVVLLAATLYVLTNLAIDLLYPLLDPRIRQGNRP